MTLNKTEPQNLQNGQHGNFPTSSHQLYPDFPVASSQTVQKTAFGFFLKKYGIYIGIALFLIVAGIATSIIVIISKNKEISDFETTTKALEESTTTFTDFSTPFLTTELETTSTTFVDDITTSFGSTTTSLSSTFSFTETSNIDVTTNESSTSTESSPTFDETTDGSTSDFSTSTNDAFTTESAIIQSTTTESSTLSSILTTKTIPDQTTEGINDQIYFLIYSNLLINLRSIKPHSCNT